MTSNDAAEVAANVARTIAAEVETAADPFLAASDYVADALEARYVVSGGGHVTAVHLVTGTGGPHVELRHAIGSNSVDVEVWWWSDRGTAFSYCPALAAELDGLAEAWTDAAVIR